MPFVHGLVRTASQFAGIIMLGIHQTITSTVLHETDDLAETRNHVCHRISDERKHEIVVVVELGEFEQWHALGFEPLQ